MLLGSEIVKWNVVTAKLIVHHNAVSNVKETAIVNVVATVTIAIASVSVSVQIVGINFV